MDVPKNFNTAIDELLDLMTDDTIFLSSWNKSGNILDFPNEILNNIFKESIEYKNCYAFSDDMDPLKIHYMSSSKVLDNDRDVRRVSIISNGTIASFLSLRILGEKLGHVRALLISPIYFSYIRLLSEMGADTYYLEIDADNYYSLPMDEIEKFIVDNDINLLIVNDPIYGAGISIKEEEYLRLSEICTKYDCYLLVDYVYGGLEWEKPISIINDFLVDLALKNDRIIVIHSISKSIFLNGVKISTVISSSEINRILERRSVHTTGSMTWPQVIMYKHVYAPENRKQIIDIIAQTIDYSKQNYNSLKNLIKGSDFKLLNCESGYFCLLGIPKGDSTLSAYDFSKKVLLEDSVLILPHDRYLFYFDDNYYYSKVNLLLDREMMILGTNRLLEKYGNK